MWPVGILLGCAALTLALFKWGNKAMLWGYSFWPAYLNFPPKTWDSSPSSYLFLYDMTVLLLWESGRQADRQVHSCITGTHVVFAHMLCLLLSILFTTTFQAPHKPKYSILWPVSQGSGFQTYRPDNPTPGQLLMGGNGFTCEPPTYLLQLAPHTLMHFNRLSGNQSLSQLLTVGNFTHRGLGQWEAALRVRLLNAITGAWIVIVKVNENIHWL